MKKRVISMALVIVIVIGLLPIGVMAVSIKDFTDLKTDAWYYDYIDHVVEKGYFNGMSDTQFQPKIEMTRAMFVTVIARIEGAEINNDVASSFPDCKGGAWYTGSIEWAAENGVVKGYEDGSFRPHGNVTRQEMCTIMNRYIQWRCERTGEDYIADGEDVVFSDASDIAAFAVEHIQSCVKAGLVKGYPDGSFLPRNNSNRAEVATVVCRLDQLVNEETDTEPAPGTGPGPGADPTPGPGGDPEPTYTDYICNAVSGASSDLAGLAKSHAVKAGALSSEYKAYIAALNEAASDIELGNDVSAGYECGDIAGEKRPVTIEAGIQLNQNAANHLVKIAAGSAVMILGEEGNVVWSEIKSVVDAVKEDLALFGLSPVSELDAAQITEVIYNYVKSKSGIWTGNFKGEDGYYTGDITAACGDVTAIIKVSEKGVSVENWKEQSNRFAAALAKEIYDAVTEKASDYVHELENIEALINITFSEGAYKNDTDNFPYAYPVTLNLDFANEVDFLRYKYAGYNHLKLVIDEQAQAEIKDKADAIADEVMASEAVKAKISEAIDGAMATDQFRQLIDLLVKCGQTEKQANKLVRDYLELWINKNVEKLMAGEEWDNSAIYGLVYVVGGMIYDWVVETLGSAGLVLSSSVSPDKLEKNLEYAGVSLDVDEALKGYVFAVICDKASGKEYYAAETGEYYIEMKAYVDTTIEDAIESEPNFRKAMDYADMLREIFADMSNLENVKLGELATILRIEPMQDYVSAKGDESYVAQLCAYLEKIPAGASMTIADVEIDEAKLAALKSADTVAEICVALAVILETEGLAEMPIGGFAPEAGQDITVSGDEQTFKANLVIEIQ